MVNQDHHMVMELLVTRFCLKFQRAQSLSVPRYVFTKGVFLINIVMLYIRHRPLDEPNLKYIHIEISSRNLVSGNHHATK